jgi:thioredoxin 1
VTAGLPVELPRTSCAAAETKPFVAPTEAHHSGNLPVCLRIVEAVKRTAARRVATIPAWEDAMTGTIELDDGSFDAAIESQEGLTLVDFWAPWCALCRAIAPMLDELAGQLAGRPTVAKVNVDDNTASAARFGIQSIAPGPHLARVLPDGAERHLLSGGDLRLRYTACDWSLNIRRRGAQ